MPRFSTHSSLFVQKIFHLGPNA